MTNFTKGPWYVVAGNENHGPYVTSDHAYSGDICDLYHKNDYDDGFRVKQGAIKSIDNANLIAAAPDMLGALEEAVKTMIVCLTNAQMEVNLGNDRFEGVPDCIRVYIDLAKSAIAKAKGKTQ